MKILFVHDHRFYAENSICYSTKFTSSTWKPYLINGNNLVVYARRSTNVCPQKCSDEGIEFKLTDYYTDSLSFLKNYLKIKNELEVLVNDCDRVIVRLPSVLGVMACKIAKLLNKKIMAEVVGDAYDAYRYYGTLQGKLLAPLFKYLNKKYIYDCDAVLYVTNSYLQSLYPTRGISIGCSDVYIEDVPITVLNNRITRIHDRKGKIICGEIGNISMPYKGYEVMIKAIRRLKNMNIDVEYQIAGGGNPKKVLDIAKKYGLEKSVVYRGMIEHRKIYQFYDSIDIYVHPSLTEGLPRVVIEAISRGCPCLASNAGGTPEIIDKKYIHKIKDYKKLSDDIISLYSDIRELENVAIKNYESAKQYYSDYLETIRLDFYSKFYNL